MNKPLKVLLTNETIFRIKYGQDYQSSIQPAIEALIKADLARGIDTRFIAVDNGESMIPFQAQPVTQATSQIQNKRAIDAICKKLTPAYICILGSVDVIPHQDLVNPVGGDGDAEVQSDLPYACDHAYSKNITDFLLPTRAVGRLPDLTGGNDANYLTQLISHSVQAKSLSHADFLNYFGVTAQEWQQSTHLSLKNVFGDSSSLQEVPATSPPWGDLLNRNSHFINCHGAPADHRFYGQLGSDYPVAHDATQLDNLRLGTVASVECCYGAELYDPSLTGGQPGICNTYLALGAYAFWGSTTIAYGPAVGNGLADLICQHFMKFILAGNSTGEAGLRARLEYIGSLSIADPTDLKTLAQFNLIGDPSLFPVSTVQSKSTLIKASSLKNLTKANRTEESSNMHAVNWQAQRQHLVKLGQVLGRLTTSIIPSSKKESTADIQKLLEAELSKQEAKAVSILSYTVQTRKSFLSKSKTFPNINPFEDVHVAVGELPKEDAPFRKLLVVVAKQQGTELVINYVYSK